MVEFVQRHLLTIILVIAGLLLLLGVVGLLTIQRELPARDFTILVSEQDSGHDEIAQKYKQLFKARGLNITIRSTSGAQETLRLLHDGQAGAAVVPGFLTSDIDPSTFSSLGALFDEPLWVFYNKGAFGGDPVTVLTQLVGRRVAIGLPGTGSQALALQLLNDSGISAGNTTLLELPRHEETQRLMRGELDAVLLLDAYQAETVQTLLRAPSVELANLAQAQAYTARRHALKIVELPQGVIDLRANIPSEDKQLLASAANLVIRRDLNITLARSLMLAAMLLHSKGDYLAPPYTYPDLTATDLPVQPQYVDFFNRLKAGGNLLTTFPLPFWTAYTMDRYFSFLLPFIVLLVLVFAYAPALWRFYMRGKVLPSYKVLRQVEADLPAMNVAEASAAIERLKTMEVDVTQHIRIASGYLPDVFLLRGHIRSVMADLMAHRDALEAQQPATDRTQCD